MARSLKKGPFVAPHLLKKVKNAQETKSRQIIKTWSRESVVIPEMVGLTISVHNGKKHIPVHVSEDKVGCKLGEFAFTRTYKAHAGQK
jgi:small subunit ribosomal protein S19